MRKKKKSTAAPRHCERCNFRNVEINGDINSLHYSNCYTICDQLEDQAPESYFDCPHIDVNTFPEICIDCGELYDCHFNQVPGVNKKQVEKCLKDWEDEVKTITYNEYLFFVEQYEAIITQIINRAIKGHGNPGTERECCNILLKSINVKVLK